jgi:tight adherence protein C
MPSMLVPSLVFVAVVCFGGAAITARSARKKRIMDRLEAEPYLAGEAARPAPMVGMLNSIGTRVSSGRYSQTLRANLARAGYHHNQAPAIFLGAKMVLMAAGVAASILVLVSLSVPLVLKLVVLGAVVSVMFFLPNVVVFLRKRRRAADIANHLPDAIDLLEVCVSAGMGLDMAWNSVSEEISRVSGDLGDEMALTNLEMHLGESRIQAMKHMAVRTGATELGSLSAVLAQSERFGTSVSEALRTFAGSMREERSGRAEEASEKMAVALLFPMVLLVFPALLIVIVGPAAIKFAQHFL